ncbi:MAG: alkaline phosphatase D family protein [Gammaproteobacteria bacterium]|nr:alkaline phosphatase D family protein [Gammaproteobacteria bacterium]
MQRRQFLQSMAASSAAISLLSVTACQPQEVKSSPNKNLINAEDSPKIYFPQSILSAEPRAQSIIVWTRLEDSEQSAEDLDLVLQVAKDSEFTQLVIEFSTQAKKINDGCVSVKLTELESSQHYYYRFLYAKDNSHYASRVGRTKTAPAAEDLRPLKFAQVCCQDYVGRFYNIYHQLIAQDDLDFVLFLGDYIYETTRDPRFQTDNGRRFAFDDQASAIQLGSNEAPFYAARSLDNYRQLYKLYRSDPLLQQVHEQFPMIAIWDDHEFADDSFGANSTHSAGRNNEKDLERKASSEQAFFEFIPIDLNLDEVTGTQNFKQAEQNKFPNTQIYRSFNFGKNLELVVSDFRTHRPDHLIPEDAFPGAIIFNQTVLSLMLSSQGIEFDSIKQYFSPYVDIDAGKFAAHKTQLKENLIEAYQAQGLALEDAKDKVGEVVSGNISLQSINYWLSDSGLQIGKELAGGIGFAYELLGKITLFGEVGSRYFVVKQAYDLLASAAYTLNSSSQNAFGKYQELWLRDRLFNATANWKILANSVAMNSFLLDLRDPKLKIPAPFNQNFYMNLDHWDGFPNKRLELLSSFESLKDLVILSGDLHAALVGTHQGKIKEFTAPAVSSSPQTKMIGDTAKKNPVLGKIPKLDILLANANELILNGNNELEFVEMAKNGLVIHELDTKQLTTHYYFLPADMTPVSYYKQPARVLEKIQTQTFVTQATK